MQALRKKKNHIITTILFSLMILSFVIWGGYNLDEGGSSTLTSVNGEEIPYREFAKILQNQMEAYGQAFGGGKALNESLTQLIERQVAVGLVMQVALSQEARDLGIVIGDQEVLEKLHENKAFHDPEKQRFSPSIYRRLLEYNDMQPAQYEAQMKREMSSQRFKDLVEQSLWVSSQEKKDAFSIQESAFNLQVATYKADALAKAGRLKLSETALKEYYSKHQGEFLSTTRRNVSVAHFSSDTLQDQIKVTDAEVQKFYDDQLKANPAQWNEAQAHAYHILISDPSPTGLEQIKKIEKDLKSKGLNLQNFMAAAKASSEDYSNSSKGGDLGYFEAKKMVKAFSEAVFKAKTKTLVGPVKTDYGYHLIWVEDATGTKSDFNSRKNQARFELLAQRLPQEISKIQTEAEAIAKTNSKDVGDRLKALGFRVFTQEKLDSQTRSTQVPYFLIQDIMQSELKKWSTPKTIQNDLFTFQVLSEVAPEPLKFEEARKSISKRLESEQLESIAREDHEKLSSGKMKWTELSRQGVEVKENKGFKVFSSHSVPGLGESEIVLRAAQALTAGASYSGVLSQENSRILLYATDFVGGGAISADKEKAIEEELKSSKRAAVLNQVVDSLVKNSRIPEKFKKKYNL